MLITKQVSKQFLKQRRHQAKYLVRYLYLPSKHMTPEIQERLQKEIVLRGGNINSLQQYGHGR